MAAAAASSASTSGGSTVDRPRQPAVMMANSTTRAMRILVSALTGCNTSRSRVRSVPIGRGALVVPVRKPAVGFALDVVVDELHRPVAEYKVAAFQRSEEHTSELQSLAYL